MEKLEKQGMVRMRRKREGGEVEKLLVVVN